jgi:hypothetical protein
MAIWNGKLRLKIELQKYPLENEYTAQSNCDHWRA